MNRNKIQLKTGNEIIFLTQEEIVAIQAENIYSILLLKENKIVKVALSLSAVLSLLDTKLFYKIHRSYVINCDAIEKIDLTGSTVQLQYINTAFPIARQQKKAFLAFLKER